MRVELSYFWLPKRGNADEEFEDAYAVYADGKLHRNRENKQICRDNLELNKKLLIAVADGATETSFSDLWAKILVRQFCAGKKRPDVANEVGDWLSRCRRTWQRAVTQKPLPWYAEHKRQLGAFATLIGLEISIAGDTRGGHWKAVGLGDSCLFQFRGNALIAHFPIDRWEDFSSRPTLLSSVPFTDNADTQFRTRDGNWEIDDEFYLATDAVAHWILHSWHLKDADPYFAIKGIPESEDFRTFVSRQRGDRLEGGMPRMRNDDATLVRFSLVS